MLDATRMEIMWISVLKLSSFFISQMTSTVIHFIFSLQTNLKLYHWTTTSYSRHKAMDELIETFLSSSDSFVENYIGKYGRRGITGKKMSDITIAALNDDTVVNYLTAGIRFLTNDLPIILHTDDVDLFTIRDDLVAALNKARYLCTLR